jgi:DNA-binding IscR family transcriptional regulator
VRTTTTPVPADEAQRRELLSAIGDDVGAAVLAVLATRPSTQAHIIDASGVERSGVSRSLARLRQLGLVESGRGREAAHSLSARPELLELLAVADRLAVAITERRAAAQRALAQESALAARKARTESGASGSSGGAEGAR